MLQAPPRVLVGPDRQGTTTPFSDHTTVVTSERVKHKGCASFFRLRTKQARCRLPAFRLKTLEPRKKNGTTRSSSRLQPYIYGYCIHRKTPQKVHVAKIRARQFARVSSGPSQRQRKQLHLLTNLSKRDRRCGRAPMAAGTALRSLLSSARTRSSDRAATSAGTCHRSVAYNSGPSTEAAAVAVCSEWAAAAIITIGWAAAASTVRSEWEPSFNGGAVLGVWMSMTSMVTVGGSERTSPR